MLDDHIDDFSKTLIDVMEGLNRSALSLISTFAEETDRSDPV